MQSAELYCVLTPPRLSDHTLTHSLRNSRRPSAHVYMYIFIQSAWRQSQLKNLKHARITVSSNYEVSIANVTHRCTVRSAGVDYPSFWTTIVYTLTACFFAYVKGITRLSLIHVYIMDITYLDFPFEFECIFGWIES